MLNSYDILNQEAAKIAAAGAITKDKLSEIRDMQDALRIKEKGWTDELIAMLQEQDQERRKYLSQSVSAINELLGIIEGKEEHVTVPPEAPAAAVVEIEPLKEAAE